jgi:hypothetical protein
MTGEQREFLAMIEAWAAEEWALTEHELLVCVCAWSIGSESNHLAADG